MAKTPAAFDENTPLYRVSSTVGRTVCVGLLWTLCSLPLVTAGAASCAALAEFADPENRSPHPLVRCFFQNLRRCFGRATALWLGLCALLLLLAVDLTFYQQFPIQAAWGRQVLLTAVFILADLAVGVLRFAFFLLAEGSREPLGALLRRAGKMALLRPGTWACMLLIDLFLAVFLISAPYFLFLLPILPGILACIHSGLIARSCRGPEKREKK